MKNMKVTYHNEVTVNLGNFQNIKPGYGFEADLEDGENPRDAFKKVQALVDALLEENVDTIKRDMVD